MDKTLGILTHYLSTYGGGGGVSSSGGGGGGVSSSGGGGGGVSSSGGGGGVSSAGGIITLSVISSVSGHPMKTTQQIKIVSNTTPDIRVVLQINFAFFICVFLLFSIVRVIRDTFEICPGKQPSMDTEVWTIL